MRRRATIALHWLTATLLLFVLGDGGATAWLAWLYAASGLAMCALALVFGLMNGPGPKLEGAFRMGHPWLHRGLYLLIGWGAVALLAETVAGPLPGPSARVLLLTLLAAALIHSIFNLWRHTALGDGALRRMTPRFLHHIL
jgi:cytochrome b561